MSERQRDPLQDLHPYFHSLIERLAAKDRRSPFQELAWLIEAYAAGRLKDIGDEKAIPRVEVESPVGKTVVRPSQPLPHGNDEIPE